MSIEREQGTGNREQEEGEWEEKEKRRKGEKETEEQGREDTQSAIGNRKSKIENSSTINYQLSALYYLFALLMTLVSMALQWDG